VFEPELPITEGWFGYIPTVFWLGGGTISLSCWMYMGLMMLCGRKYL